MATKDKDCFACKKTINFKEDLFVLLGTYDGDRTVREDFFHMICWRNYFEERARLKAEAVVNGMQKRMMPIAQQLTDKIKKVIDNN